MLRNPPRRVARVLTYVQYASHLRALRVGTRFVRLRNLGRRVARVFMQRGFRVAHGRCESPSFPVLVGQPLGGPGGQDSDFAISGQVEMDGIQTLRHPFKVLLDWLLVSPQVQFLLVAMSFRRRSKTVSHSLDLVHSVLPFCRKVPISSRFRRVCSSSLILDGPNSRGGWTAGWGTDGCAG